MSKEFENHEEFFEHMGETVVRTKFYETDCHISVEEMYQHFKARLISEVFVISEELLSPVDLQGRSED